MSEKILYYDYAEVPLIIRDYIEAVADVATYTQIPLEDINGLMEAAEQYYSTKPTKDELTEWEDGWVL